MSENTTFRNMLPDIFLKFDDFVMYISNKQHLYAFIVFFSFICCTKKTLGNRQYLLSKTFKEKTCIEDHIAMDSKIHSIPSTDETDYFCLALKDIFNKIEASKCISNLDKSGTKSPSPRKYIEQLKKKKQNNVSNYQKYIKNIKHVRDSDSITPSTSQNEVKSSKYSFDPLISKYKTGDKDDSLSINMLKFNGSTNDISDTSKINKLNILTDATDERKLTENNSLDNMMSHVNVIESKFNVLEEEIRLFEMQTKNVKDLLDSL